MPKSSLSRRIPVFLAIAFTCSALVSGEDAVLTSQLLAVHDKWFKAFDNHDSDTVNLIETKDITLVMANGYILKNFAPRKKEDTQNHPDITRTLSNVSVRRYGDSALLVGVVTSESPREKSQSAETVFFVKVSGEWKIASVQWTTVAKPK